LEKFLGNRDTPALYPLLAVLIAVEIGQSDDVADRLYAALQGLGPEQNLDWRWKSVDRPSQSRDNLLERAALETLKSVKAASPKLGAALSAAQRKSEEGGGTVGDYLALAHVVRRYSFNRSDGTAGAGAA
jgi:hypothetical protein